VIGRETRTDGARVDEAISAVLYSRIDWYSYSMTIIHILHVSGTTGIISTEWHAVGLTSRGLYKTCPQPVGTVGVRWDSYL